jgi:hypothetical protein
MNVILEVGKIRTFAIAIDWPGWCRSGHDEASALQALFEYGPRYMRALMTAALTFQAPTEISTLVVIERLEGNATTDFGAPGIPLSYDTRPVDADELRRMQLILEACWNTFDSTVQAAEGKILRKGPRGGGRDLAKIIDHVREVDAVYLHSLGGKPESRVSVDISLTKSNTRKDILTTLAAAVRGEISAKGPRGGLRWTPRYFVRRLAWHELDHAWEIEDRAE